MVNETIGKWTHGYKYTAHCTRWQNVPSDTQPGFSLFNLPGNFHYYSTLQSSPSNKIFDKTSKDLVTTAQVPVVLQVL